MRDIVDAIGYLTHNGLGWRGAARRLPGRGHDLLVGR
jgi:hypothetical protein